MNHELLVEGTGILAGIFTASSQLPQVIKTWKKKEAEDISSFMLAILLGGIALWIVYGILRKDIPIIATNSFSFIVNVMLIVLRIKYEKG